MAFRRARFEREGQRVLRPRRPVVVHAHVLEVMLKRERTHGRGPDRRITPQQRPVFLEVRMPEARVAQGDGLGLWVLEPGGHPIHHVEVALQPAIRERALVVGALLRPGHRPFPDVAEVEDVLAVGEKRVREQRLPVAEYVAIPEALAGCVLPGVEEVHEPRRGEDPVLHALVVVTVGAQKLTGAMVKAASERRPFLRVPRFTHQGECGDPEPRGRNEIVILGEMHPLLRRRQEGVVHKIGVTLERGPDPRAFGRGEVVVEQVVGPAQGVEKMARGEVGIGLVVGVAPRLVVDGGERPGLRRGQVFGFALHRVRETDLGHREGDDVLRAALLGTRGGGWSAFERGQIREDLRPLRAVGGPGAFAEGFKARLGHEHARVHADELRLELDLVREELGEGRNRVLRSRASRHGEGQDQRRSAPLRLHAVCSLGSTTTLPMRPASPRVTTSPTGPSTPAIRNTGVYP